MVVASALGLGLTQAPRTTVRILSPESGAVVSGEVTLQAEALPAGAAEQVRDLSFSVDGREVCKLTEVPFECVWDAGPDVDEHVIRVVARFRDGTRAVTSVRTKGLGYVDRVDVDAIQLAVVVTDDAGRFVPNLPREAFRVFEDDRPQQVSTFVSENVPLELVAALDVSQSMTDAMPKVKQAARAFLSALGTGEQVTLLAFNDNIFTLARRATGPEARLRAVERLAPWGGTALYDVIIKGIDLLGRRPGRRALVVFSDGEDQSSRSTLAAARARVESTDATVYAVGLGRAMQARDLRTLLEGFADISGGRGLFRNDPAELEQAFSEIVQDLANQYLLGYQPANQRRDGEWRRLRVEVQGGRYKVRHRLGYRLVAGAHPFAGSHLAVAGARRARRNNGHRRSPATFPARGRAAVQRRCRARHGRRERGGRSGQPGRRAGAVGFRAQSRWSAADDQRGRVRAPECVHGAGNLKRLEHE
jgi:Ca-activated chloride channel family protein